MKEVRSSASIAKILLSVIFTCALLVMSTAAHADSYVTYDVDGTFTSGGSLAGAFTVDTTDSVITAANIVADGIDFGCPDGLSNGCILYTGIDQHLNQTGFLLGPNASQFLVLDWGENVDPSAFALNSYIPNVYVGTYCIGCAEGVSQDFLASGTATDPPSPTPEPNVAFLLLSGLGGLGFLGFRRTSADRA